MNARLPTSSSVAQRASQSHTAAGRKPAGAEEYYVGVVLTQLIMQFLQITASEDVELARKYIAQSNMDIDKAIVMYYSDL